MWCLFQRASFGTAFSMVINFRYVLSVDSRSDLRVEFIIVQLRCGLKAENPLYLVGSMPEWIEVVASSVAVRRRDRKSVV